MTILLFFNLYTFKAYQKKFDLSRIFQKKLNRFHFSFLLWKYFYMMSLAFFVASGFRIRYTK